MNVYIVCMQEGFSQLGFTREEDIDGFILNGTSRIGNWNPIRMVEVWNSEEERKSGLPDIPASIDPMLSVRATDALREFLEPNGEILPIRCATGEFSVFNCMKLIPALDVEHSQISYSDDGEMLGIRRQVFKADVVSNNIIFKLDIEPKGLVYVTQPFVDRVEEAGLIGFRFDPVEFSYD